MNIFDKVLFIGPDIDAKGGIASVLKSYKEHLPAFHYLKSNSRHGTIPGLFSLLWVFISLPFIRLFTCRSILHIHVATGKSFIRKSWIISWGRILGYKIIFHSHSGKCIEYFRKVGLSKIKRTIDKCNHIVVLSDAWKEYFRNTFGYTNITIINNIVSPAISFPNKNRNIIELLFLGLIKKDKGIFDLIEVIGQNKNIFKGKIHLTIGGVGDREQLEAIISDLGIIDMIDFVGWVSGETKNRLIHDCDIVILPSYIEGLPITLLEAMAYGKATISTNVGGIPSIVHNGFNGFIIEPGDKGALFSAIRHYVETPSDLLTHGKNGLQIVKSFYPDEVCKQLETLYDNLNI